MVKIITNFKNEKKGNITILILIMSFVVILLTTAMMSFIFHDVKFIEQDKEKLRALNIAEAGLSNMFLQIESYYNGTIDDLPLNPYTREVLDNDSGELEGTFKVEYESQTDGNLTIYNVTSTGIDKSGIERTVRVKINVLEPGPALDIYDYVYSAMTLTTSGNFKPVDGPFYTDGDFNLTGGSGITQVYSEGPITIKGNLYMSGDTVSLTTNSLSVGGNVVMEGSAKILGAQVNIAGNLAMYGGTYINENLISPMIVMGDIYMEGSSQIGEDGKELTLSCNGTLTTTGGATVYATRDDSLTYTFVDPGYSVSELIDEYWSEVQDSALVINGNLTLDDQEVPYDFEDSGGNSLSYVREGDNYILEVHGNVVVDGNLQIGIEDWWIPDPEFGGPSTNEIIYRGKGIIYSTGNITTLTKLIPENVNDFPESVLLVLISNEEISLDIWRDYWVQPPECSNPTMYMVGLAKGDITVEKGVIRGTLISGGTLNIDNSFTRICYEQGISEQLPEELPRDPSGGGEVVITSGEWQEAIE